ncbi:hypothetical protein JCM8547_008091 [Rhodosporidiobolus lusitaniae]
MDVPLISAKRSTPPPASAHALLPHPSSSNLPRLDHPSSSAALLPNGSHRRPRRTKHSGKAVERQPEELRGVEEQVVSQLLEVDDAAEYPDALLSIQTLFNRLHHPTRQHLRLLLSLTLFPLLFKPPQKSTNPSFARGTASIRTAPTLSSSILPASDEPLEMTNRKVRELARRVVEDVVGTSGVEVVCRAIRGSGVPEVEKKQEELERGEAETPIELAEEATKSALKGGSGKKPLPSLSGPSDGADDEDLTPHDEDDALSLSAKRIGQAEDIWDFLAGTTAKKARLRSRDKCVVEGGGWSLVEVLVRGWEEERERKEKARGADGGEADQPTPLSLLRYFKPSASSASAREFSPKALDIVFWPFSAAAAPVPTKGKKGRDSDDEDEDMYGDSDDDEEEDKKGTQEEEEMSLKEKREVAVRLLGLIGSCAVDGYLSGPSLLCDVIQRMKSLKHADFGSFIELLTLHSLPSSPFAPRLFTLYLETHSHALSSTPASILPPSALSSSTLNQLQSSSASAPTSPRKRALGASSTLDSLTSIGSRETATALGQHSSFWRLPSLSSPLSSSSSSTSAAPAPSADLLPLLVRIPIEVPLPSPPSSTSSSSSSLPLPLPQPSRRPAPSSSTLPKSFDRAALAADAHRVIKSALVALLLQRGEEEEGEGWVEEAREVMRRVEGVVEEARGRVEGR